jgi:site-specific DNA-adenine methylase
MISQAGTIAAPFPYFGGKSGACETVWKAFGTVDNYVEPFAGSAAMLLGAPDGIRTETINDFDGFVSNFWRAIAADPDAVAHHADWPCNENDLFSRHSWLVRQREDMTERLHADPEWFDAKIAGWWCWGACNWIGSGWCEGKGPWVHDGERIVDARQLPHLGDAGQGINRKLPHLGDAGKGINRQLPHLGNAGRGINRQLPHLGNAGRGINRQLPHLGDAGRGTRREFIFAWMTALHERMRNVRVTCGDWRRVVKYSVTTRHGLTGVFLDPPYDRGAMDYGNGGMGLGISSAVREWCAANGADPLLRIVLCGHAGEHDALIDHGWRLRTWTARKGYALTDEAVENSASETLWCSPACVPETNVQRSIFDFEAT